MNSLPTLLLTALIHPIFALLFYILKSIAQ
jgi:hypothetical protein